MNATPLGTWWASPVGSEAQGWFSAWGLVERERMATGDASAVPMPDGVVRGGKRGSPSDIPDVLAKAIEVQAFLSRMSPRRVALVRYVFVTGWIDATPSVVYEFADGTSSDPAPFDAEPPPAYSRATVKTFPIWTFDFNRFPSPEVDEVCRMWGRSKESFLSAELKTVGIWFARDRLLCGSCGS